MLGIMQGRLSEKNEGQYQSHPTHWWQKEFRIAKKMQFDCIEFIIDKQSAVTNPLLTEKGVLEIQNVIKETGVVVKSICADIFMDEPLNHTNGHIIDARLQLLDKLIEAADKINCRDNCVAFCGPNRTYRGRYRTTSGKSNGKRNGI